MAPSFLRRLLYRVTRRVTRRRPAHVPGPVACRPLLKALEDRTLPAIITWTNPAGGDWDNPKNWSTKSVPTSTDDVIINQTVIPVTHNASTPDAVHTLTSKAALAISGGTLSFAAASSINNALTLSGGTLAGPGDLTVNKMLTWTGGTMSGGGTTFATGGLTENTSQGNLVLNGRTLTVQGAVVPNQTSTNLTTLDSNPVPQGQTPNASLTGMTPAQVDNSQDVTVQFSGEFPVQTAADGTLTTSLEVQFFTGNGQTTDLLPMSVPSNAQADANGLTTTLLATIPANTLTDGVYSIQITGIAYSQTLINALTVTQGSGTGILQTSVSAPNPVSPHTPATIYVTYSNVGTGPLTAPLLVLTATRNGQTGALLTLDSSLLANGLYTSANPDGFSQSVQFLASGTQAGVLQPGESVTVPVYYAGWQSGQWTPGAPVKFSLGSLDTSSSQAIDWNSLKNVLKPGTLSDAAWNALFPNLTARLGSTWGSYLQQLNNDSQYLASLGENVTDLGQLFGFEVQQANGFSPLPSLTNSTDAQIAATGMALLLARTFAATLAERNRSGPFGWGWSDNWDTSLLVEADGTVDLSEPDGGLRRFQPNNNGGYIDQPGEAGTLAHLDSGGFTLTEPNGSVTAYNYDGSFGYSQDGNGDRITADYANGLLTGLTSSSGSDLALTYDAAGHVSTITDSAGNVTSYTYDSTDQYLLGVKEPDGETTTYTYDTSSNSETAHDLQSVTYPDGSHEYFSYDTQGRLIDTQRDGGAADTTYSYNEGQVKATNSQGTTAYSYDAQSHLVQEQDPLGNTTSFSYDAAPFGASPLTFPPTAPLPPSSPSSSAISQTVNPAGASIAVVGPSGYGPAGFVTPNTTLPYQIDFANAASATAPAQQVEIIEQLDPNLDWSTFRLTGAGFGGNVLSIPSGSQHYHTTVDMTVNGETFQVVIDLGLDAQTGIFHASFQALDPSTGLPPDVLTGFLPPEDGSGGGTGYVSYLIHPKAGLTASTQIGSVAQVTLDHTQTIATDPTQAVVTIDSVPPTSSVAPLPAVTLKPTFNLSWSGADDPGGSGLAYYSIFVSDNGGSFTPLLTNTTQMSVAFTGVMGHTYAFYSVATDNAGNVQPTPAAAQATIHVNINRAPVLDGSTQPFLPPIAHDTANPPGVAIASFADAVITDADTGSPKGIAVVGTTGTGTWYYSSNAGATWTAFGTIAPTSALLLADTDQVRFVPAAGYHGLATITYRAWDQTTGTDGGTVDLSAAGATGGTTAFSTATATANLVVAQTLVSIPENTTNPAGTTISSFVETSVSTSKTQKGIAVVGLSGTGTWQYLPSGGTTWLNFGTVSLSAARLLLNADKVRFIPAANWVGTASLSYYLWDGTNGTHGGLAKLTGGTGGATAFGATAVTAMLVVTPVHQAPVLTPGVVTLPPLLPLTGTSTPSPAGNPVASLLGSVVPDADAGGLYGMAVLGVTGTGTWQYLLPDSGLGWQNMPTIPGGQALLLRDTDQIRFVPALNYLGTATVNYRAWDQTSAGYTTKLTAGSTVRLTSTGGLTAFSSASQTATLLVNTAPQLTPTGPKLGSIQEDTPSSPLYFVYAFADATISDPDPGAQKGIAVTGQSGGGTWQYSIDFGHTWHAFPAVSSTAALLLRNIDLVRFLPTLYWSGSATLTYAGWDRTSGNAGGMANLTLGTGGATSFSAASDTFSLTINPVNHAPVLKPSAMSLTSVVSNSPGNTVASLLGSLVTDVDPGALQGIAIIGTTGNANGTWQYSSDGTNWNAIPTLSGNQAFLLLSTDSIRFLPNTGFLGSATITYRAWDQTQGTPHAKYAINATGGNSAFSSATRTATVKATAAPMLKA